LEEFLRYDSPIQFTDRTPIEDLEIDGKLIQKGRMATLFLGAINWDPARFLEPNRLDVGRTDNRHLSLGHGIHYCLDPPLGRLEAQIAISAMLERCPRLHLDADAVEWQPNLAFRGPKAPPVAW
jgi:cytochrome P450